MHPTLIYTDSQSHTYTLIDTHIHSQIHRNTKLPHSCKNKIQAPHSGIWDPPKPSQIIKASFSHIPTTICMAQTQGLPLVSLHPHLTLCIQFFTQQTLFFFSVLSLLLISSYRSAALDLRAFQFTESKPELLSMIYEALNDVLPTSPPTCSLAQSTKGMGLSFCSLNKLNSSYASLHCSLFRKMLFTQLFLWLADSFSSFCF